MTDDNDTYLDRTAREALAHDLNTITTWLADDLDTVITKQINYQGRGNTRSNESPWPMHLTASDASWDLINTLHAWIDTVVTQRHYPHPGRLRAAQAAKWLHQHLIALSLCENADQAADEIHHVIACQLNRNAAKEKRAPVLAESKRHGRGDPLDQWVHMTLRELVALLAGHRVEDS